MGERRQFSLIEHMSSSDSGKEGEAQSQKEFLEDPSIARQLDYETRKMDYLHGRLVENHPVQQYVDSLISRFPEIDGVELRVRVSPDWKDINAGAFPDGTIYLSRNLFSFVESEEELLAVIAHEYVHVAREHTLKTSKQEGGWVDAFLKRKGLERLHEYEADTRGAMELLQDAGVNPLAMKVLMDRLDARRRIRKERADSSHGFASDRSLNISTMAHVVDLEHVEDDFTPLREGLVEQIDDPSGKLKSSVVFRYRPAHPRYKGEVKNEQRKIRRELADSIDVSDIPFALASVSEDVDRYGKDHPKHDPGDVMIQQKLLDRFIEAHPAPAGVENQQMYRQFVLSHVARAGEYVSFPEGSRDEIESYRVMIDAVTEHGDFDPFSIRPKGMFSFWIYDAPTSVMRIALEKHFFGDPTSDSFDAEGLGKFVGRWYASVDAFAERYAIDKGRVHKAHEVTSIMNREESGISDYETKLKILLACVEYPFSGYDAFKAGSDVGAGTDWAEQEKSVQEYAQRLVEEFKPENIAQLCELLSTFMEGCQFGKISKGGDYFHVLRIREEPVEVREGIDPSHRAMQIFDHCTREMSFFEGYSDFERQLIRYQAANVLGLDMVTLESKESLLKRITERDTYTDVDSTYSVTRSDDIYEDDLGPHDDWYDERRGSDDEPFLDDWSSDDEDDDEDVGLPRSRRRYSIEPMKPERKQESQKKGDDEVHEAKQYSPEETQTLVDAIRDHKGWIDQDFLKRDHDEQELKQIYTWLGNRAKVQEQLGALTTKQEEIRSTQREVAMALVLMFGDKSLRQITEELDKYEADGYPLTSILVTFSSETGRIALKFVDVVKDGSKDLSLEQLLQLSRMVSNPYVRAKLQSVLINDHWDSLSFEQKLQILAPEGRDSGVLAHGARERLIEEDMQTKEQFKQIESRAGIIIEDLLSEGKSETGVAVLLDIDWRHRDVVDFLKALLLSNENETYLKQQIYDMAKKGAAFASAVRPEGVSVVQMSEKTLQMIYNADEMGRYVYLRRLLAGEGGALPDTGKRHFFLRMLFNEWIAAGMNDDIYDVLNKARIALQDVKDWHLLFFAFQQALIDHVGNPPPPDEAVAWSSLSGYTRQSESRDDDEEGWGHYTYEEDDSPPDDEDGTFSLSEKGVWSTIPSPAKENPSDFASEYADFADHQILLALSEIGEGHTKAESHTMSPLRFVKESVASMGSLGVRFLQQVPLIADIPREYSEEFSEVYDKVKGQSKVAAIKLLEREWDGFWDEVSHVGKRIGGGSIVTVYEVTTASGEREVVKVRNPNIKYHLDTMYTLAKEVMTELAKKHKGAYIGARLLLDDIKTWIDHDVDFVGFLEQDEKFRTWVDENDFTLGEYEVYIPQSKGAESAFYSREELVEGLNLTEWDQLEAQGHDMKAVTSLLLKFFMAQISEGQVLSDVHVGNFAVTEDKKLAVFDRNYYLELNDTEKHLVSLFLVPAGDQSEKVNAFCEYIDIDHPAVKTQVGYMVAGMANQEWLRAQKALVRIKQMGVRMPLNFTLLLKNFHALHTMLDKAGFQSFAEAFTYSS